MTAISGHSIADLIENFYGDRGMVGTNRSCPICGASLQWNWADAGNLKLHIDWHERMSFWEVR
jgi:hypothetical protein